MERSCMDCCLRRYQATLLINEATLLIAEHEVYVIVHGFLLRLLLVLRLIAHLLLLNTLCIC